MPRQWLKDGFVAGGWLADIIAHSNSQLAYHFDQWKQLLTTDERWMLQALQSAMQASSFASPNPTVGCVIVKDDELIATAATEPFGDRHAELKALMMAGPKAKDATLYVTLEPCAHEGKQPPCTEAIIQSGIKRCVVGIQDPHELVSGKGIDQLRNHGIQVELGCLHNELSLWHAAFLWQAQENQVFLAAKWAQTLNGLLADDYNESKWISHELSRTYTHWLRQHYDAILVGVNTVLQDTPQLTARLLPPGRQAKQPIRLIFDPLGKLASCDQTLQKKLFKSTFNDETPVVYLSKASLPAWIKAQHVHYLCLPEDFTLDSLKRTLRHLAVGGFDPATRPLQSVFVEGGCYTLNHLIAAGLVNRYHIFCCPLILSGHKHQLGQNLTTRLSESLQLDVNVAVNLAGNMLIEAS